MLQKNLYVRHGPVVSQFNLSSKIRSNRVSYVVRAISYTSEKNTVILKEKNKTSFEECILRAKLSADDRFILFKKESSTYIPQLEARGIRDILIVEPDKLEFEKLRLLENKSRLGNDLGIRLWCDELGNLPSYLLPARGIVLSRSLTNWHELRQDLLDGVLSLTHGGHMLVHGRFSAASASVKQPRQPSEEGRAMGEADLSAEGFAAAMTNLPLELLDFRAVEEEGSGQREGFALCRVPDFFRINGSKVLRLSGTVLHGFRVGTKIGAPTANLDPDLPHNHKALGGMPLGVYFGWAKVSVPKDWPAADAAVHKVVLNIGRRPTAGTGPGVTIESFLQHSFAGGGGNLYGLGLKVLVTGYLRPEIKFQSLDRLAARIQTDVGLACHCLDSEQMRGLATAPDVGGAFFQP